MLLVFNLSVNSSKEVGEDSRDKAGKLASVDLATDSV